MEWRSVEDHPPPNESILVYGKCGMPHVTKYDYDMHCHTECCYDNGFHASGYDIEFTHWMPLPEPPIEGGKIE